MESAFLHPDVMLMLAEHLVDDLSSVSALRRTCKHMNGLISTYETSLVKANLAMHPDPLLVSAYGTALCSATHEREVLAPNSFAVMEEYNRRSKRIDVLLQPGQPLNWSIDLTVSFRMLPPAERTALEQGLRRACRLADRLADCVGDASVQRSRQTHKKKNFQRCLNHHTAAAPEEISPMLVEAVLGNHKKDRGLSAQGNHSTNYSTHPSTPQDRPAERHDNSPESVARSAHMMQLELVRSLSNLDLAYLHTLLCLAIIAYKYHCPAFAADPNADDRELAFKEVILRQGTLALWAVLRPITSGVNAAAGGGNLNYLTALGRFSEQSMRTIVDEMHAWENNVEGTLPGLWMTLLQTFAQKANRPISRVGVDMDMVVLGDVFR